MGVLKAVFVPHKKNQYRPHAIQKHGLLLAALMILLVQTGYNWQTAKTFQVLGYATNINSAALLSGTNSNRTASGLGSLSTNAELASAAQAKAQHMVNNDYWAHVAPDGTTPWDFIRGAGYSYLKAGENLAYGFSTSAETISGWMASPSHRDNILTAEYKEVGFGIANSANFQGGENTIVVAMYGDPNVPPPPTPPAPEPTPDPAPTVQPAQAEEAPVIEQPIPAETEEEPVAAVEEEPAKEEEELAETATGETETLLPQRGQLSTESQSVSNLEAILNGQASPPLYFTTIILTMIGTIYAYRHLAFVQKAVVRGEYILHAHPLFEASLIYGIIWVVLSANYGVIQ